MKPTLAFFLALSLPSFAGAQHCLVEELHAGDSAAYDSYGQDVDHDGGRSLVGAPYADEAGSEAGAAYVFEHQGSAFVMVQKLMAPDAAADDWFGETVALDGDWAFVGSLSHERGADAGAVYVFRRDAAGTWGFFDKLFGSDTGAGDLFGRAIDVRDDLAVIGAPNHGAGAAYVFALQGGQWSEVDRLTGSAPIAPEDFGVSVALSQGDIFVGAAGVFGPTGVFRFEAGPGGWSQSQMLQAPSSPGSDGFGVDLDADGGVLVVGAPFLGPAGFSYVYEEVGGAYQFAQTLIPSTSSGGSYGAGVAVEGDWIAIGNPDTGAFSYAADFVDVYRRGSGTWQWVDAIHSVLPGGDDQGFGTNLGLRDGALLVGVHRATDTGVQSGSAQLFSLGGQPQLFAGDTAISFAQGQAQDMEIQACPSHAGRPYAVLGSVTGTAPSIDLGSTALPLVPDFYTLITLQSPALTLTGASGNLDAAGSARVTFQPPPTAPETVGLTVHHAAVILSPALEPVAASNAVTVAITP